MMIAIFFAEANMQTVKVSARLVFAPRTRASLAKRTLIAHLLKTLMSLLPANADGTIRNKDIATYCQETQSGLMSERNSSSIMRPQKSPATLRQGGNLAVNLKFTASGCALSLRLNTIHT
jgi:hypothetical protein